MAIKYTLLGLLIYSAMAAWLVAFAAYLLGKKRVGTVFFAVGAAAMAATLPIRWVQVGHPPLQELFEVFLCLGALMYPLWLFCEKVLGARGPSAGAMLGVVTLLPAGLIFSAEPRVLPPALQSWLFVPHVAAYMLSYVILVTAGLQAAMQLVVAGVRGAEAAAPYEAATYRIIRLGFPLMLLGLVLGAVWGKQAWGDYWNWDPKELWSLATLLVYVGYLHFRAFYGARYAASNALLAVGGVLAIIITLLWVNLADKLFPGLHAYTM
jgi:ABC-type transport system involved in cytochrome c biogenesis permease subunit